MKKRVLLLLLSGALAAAPASPAVSAPERGQPAANTETDAKKATAWLEEWEKGLLDDARERYCDKSLGEDLGWHMSHVMSGFYYGYQATHNQIWIDRLMDWTDSWLKRGFTEPDGGVGWPAKEAAGTKVDDLDSYSADSLLGEAMALKPVLLMAREIAQDPALAAKFGEAARRQVRAAEAIYQKWGRRGAWREAREGGVISLILPYGLGGSGGAWAPGFEERNAPGKGFSHPDNKANLVATWVLALGDATGKEEYRNRAAKWFTLMKSRMTPKPDGTYEIWNYWQPAGPWDYKPDGSPKHWVGIHPNGGYYVIDTEAIVEAYQHRLVFQEDDIKRLAATAVATSRDWEALLPYSPEIRARFVAKVKPGSWGGITSIPRYLAWTAAQETGPDVSILHPADKGRTRPRPGRRE